MIEAIAITRHPGPPLPGGTSLRLMHEDDLALIYRDAPVGVGQQASAEALWEFEAVVESLMRDRDVLPMRYGTVLDGDLSVRARIQARHAEFSDALERVRGAVELAVRALEAPPAGGAPAARRGDGAGTAYLQTKACTARHAAAAKSLHEPLAGLARASRLSDSRRSGELLAAAYLVARERVSEFRSTLTTLHDMHPQVALLCTGPWPPYSFAEHE